MLSEHGPILYICLPHLRTGNYGDAAPIKAASDNFEFKAVHASPGFAANRRKWCCAHTPTTRVAALRQQLE
jgi:hypothetical protein